MEGGARPAPDTEDRRAAFAAPPDTEDRRAAFAAPPPGIPTRAVVVALVAFVVLGLGGVAADHFFGGPVATSDTSSAPASVPPPLTPSARPSPTPTATLPASLPSLMGLTRRPATKAPGFSLTDQYGHPVSLGDLRGKVVVLTFFDAACDDICPVLASELVQAYADLGTDASRVAVVIVDTDPLVLTPGSSTPAESAVSSAEASARDTGAALSPGWPAGWLFLTGSLNELDAVWKAYGIAVDVQPGTGLVSHNDLMCFVSTSGRIRLTATPFADENSSGAFSLPPATESQWASGIASAARSLLARVR